MKDDNAEETGPIYLVGMMGSGKSTVGPALAERLGRLFVDTDDVIEERAKCRIAEIFAERGEAHFRKLEREAIELVSTADAVVALGGGAFSQPGLAEVLLFRGIVVFLDASTPLILERVGEATSRPLLAGLGATERAEKLDALRAERGLDYAKATISVSAEGSSEAIVDRIIKALAPLPSSSAKLSNGESDSPQSPQPANQANQRTQDR